MKKYLSLCAGLAGVFLSSQSFAAGLADLNWFASLGYDYGGEKYASGTFVGTNVTENAYANDGWKAMLGVSISNNAQKNWETQLSAGYKFGGPTGERSGIIWNTLPLEVTQFYRQGSWRTGLGLAYHIDTHVDFQSFGQPTETFRLNNALGYVASVNYAPVAHNYAMELRYTYLKQAFVDDPDNKLKASVFGLALHYRF